MQVLDDTQLTLLIGKLKLAVFDFDGVFTDNTVYVNERGEESVRCSRADGLGLRRLESVGVVPLILSTEKNPVVQARAQKLNVECISGSEDKLQALEQLLQDRALTWDQVSFTGNDINDESCLRQVGLPIVVADAMHEVLGLGKLITDQRGGYGAVREICDYVFQLRNGN